ncbi:lipoprotein release ABC transporter permease [Microbacterium mangrovi]|uniref:Lipoprotein release ABC transporter permease n=1 Tax=Microbacterium mangrovi TaxID=1348253 RepID=A0A0B1ZXZ7_9MICO|nr:lipoprotein release ABC transporter permease [Microbacterium mangrovi]
MIAGMVLAVMLTTGRTVGAEDKVLASIDSAGTRTILVRAEPGAGLTTDVLRRLSHIEGISWAGAFSEAIDATNARIPDGTRVPVRLVYGAGLGSLGIPPAAPARLAYASQEALAQLGLPDVAGGITLTDGTTYGIGGRITTPEFLADFEPVVVLPEPAPRAPQAVSLLLIVAAHPELVGALTDAVTSVLAPTDPTKLTIQTSETLAHLRSIIQAQLGGFSRQLLIGLLIVTGILVCVILSGLVMLRRKDFGRRRALGATRTFILGLLLFQTTVLALAGITLGAVSAVALLLVAGDPLPRAAFTIALCVLTLLTAVVAALLPAIVASRREPIRELRVP